MVKIKAEETVSLRREGDEGIVDKWIISALIGRPRNRMKSVCWDL